MKSKTFLLLLGKLCILLLASQLFIACTAQSREAATPQVIPTITPTTQPVVSTQIPTTSTSSSNNQAVQPMGNQIVANSLEELIVKSPVIVVGRVTSKDEIINTVRNPSNNTAANDLFGIGQVYSFNIERYLNGKDGTVIKVVQTEGYLVNKSNTATANDIEKAKSSSGVLPFKLNNKYLLFLAPLDKISEVAGKSYYTLSISPWRFTLPDSGNAVPESATNKFVKAFDPRLSTALLQDVEQVINKKPVLPPEPSPAPTPTPRGKVGDKVNLVKLYNLDKTVSIELKGPTKELTITDPAQIKAVITVLDIPLDAINRQNQPSDMQPPDLALLYFIFADGKRLYFEYNRKTAILVPPPTERFSLSAPLNLAQVLGWF